MSYDNIRRELERISAAAPRGVVLRLDDGSKYTHTPTARGEVLRELIDAIHIQQGPLFEALKRCVWIEGDRGRLLEVFKSWQEFEEMAKQPPARGS